jgi:hypothetical protein
MITQNNVLELLHGKELIQKSRIYGKLKWRQYILLRSLSIQLSDNSIINVPKGFQWDLSSSPRLIWPLLPPDGDFEIAALIHDYLYQNKITTRKFADKEMLIWSKIVNGNRGSMRRVDNYTRYYGVRLFGSFVWKK